MQTETKSRRRGLTRATVVARALEIGDGEGLEAVSLRRIASDFGVTTMALYRHVQDKQDLINAMADEVMEGFNLTTGFRASMTWTDKMRRALTNYKEQMDARPLALPLSIAYTGDNPVSFWRMIDDLLGVLLEAGFTRRQAIVMIRVVSNLVTGYLSLFQQSRLAMQKVPDERELELLRKRMELNELSLPPDKYPNVVASARDLSEVWLVNPDRWWKDTIDLIVFGLEATLERKRSKR